MYAKKENITIGNKFCVVLINQLPPMIYLNFFDEIKIQIYFMEQLAPVRRLIVGFLAELQLTKFNYNGEFIATNSFAYLNAFRHISPVQLATQKYINVPDAALVKNCKSSNLRNFYIF